MKTTSKGKTDKSRPNQLRVLTYHRVAEIDYTGSFDPRLISTTPQRFAQQMQYLASHYHAVTLAEVVSAVEQGTLLPPKALLITFDDAYFDLADHAFPVLKRLGLPATIFVPTAYPDQPERAFWWDRVFRALMGTERAHLEFAPLGTLSLQSLKQRIQSIRRLQNYLMTRPHTEAMALLCAIEEQLGVKRLVRKSVLSWSELKAFGKDGLSISAHTYTHPILTNLPLAEAHVEIMQSQMDIKREIGQTFPVFCYPNGCHNQGIVDLLKQEGFTVAFTTYNGQNNLQQVNPLRLNRQSIYKKSTLPIFGFRLSALGGYLETWRSGRAWKSA